jgi:1-acyl-sn-glycerol-3-phosphate acyltransferase
MYWQRFRRAAIWWGFRTLSRGLGMVGRLLYGLEAQGLEHLPSRGPAVIVGRRISRVDFFAVAFLVRIIGEFSGMTGAIVICNNRLIARLGRELGILPTLKGKGLSAAPLLEAYKLLQQGNIIVLPDEGEVPWDGHLQPLKGGAAWLALRTRSPVIVAVMEGGYDIWPRWASRPALTGKLRFKVGKPFYLSDAPYQRVSGQQLRDANGALLAEIEALSNGYLSGTGRGP